MELKENPIVQKNLSKFKLVRKSKRSNAAIYMILDGIQYKLTGSWRLELQLNIDNEKFDPIWLLTNRQMFEHSLNLLKKK
jgi:hypothetical protein